MKKTEHILHVAYWVGAIMDGAMLFPMLIPSLGSALFGIPDFHPGPEYRYAMGIGASLIAGWTVLLLWADRMPVERRGVILVTVFPVIVGMMASSLYALTSGLLTHDRFVPMILLQAALFVFYLAVYLHSRPGSATD
jgi:hypothetical protein